MSDLISGIRQMQLQKRSRGKDLERPDVSNAEAKRQRHAIASAIRSVLGFGQTHAPLWINGMRVSLETFPDGERRVLRIVMSLARTRTRERASARSLEVTCRLHEAEQMGLWTYACLQSGQGLGPKPQSPYPIEQVRHYVWTRAALEACGRTEIGDALVLGGAP